MAGYEVIDYYVLYNSVNEKLYWVLPLIIDFRVFKKAINESWLTESNRID